MQKQTHKQSASIDNSRLHIDFSGDLIKHAQKMRKVAQDPSITDELKELGKAHRMGVNPDILTESFIGRHPYLATTLGLVGAGGLAGGLSALGGAAGAPVGALVGAAKTDKENTGAIPRGAVHGGLRGAGLAGGVGLGGLLGLTGAAQLSSSLGGGAGMNAAMGGLGGLAGALGGGYLGQRAGGGAAHALVGDIKQEKEEKEEKEASDRLYIDFSGDLVKHAQKMRKEGRGVTNWMRELGDASLFYNKTRLGRDLTVPEKEYNQNVGIISGVGLGGLSLGALAALTQALRRPQLTEMSSPSVSANLPVELSVPRRRKVIRRKPEEENGEEVLSKAAEPKPLPASTGFRQPGILGDSNWNPVVTWPAALLAGTAGYYGANAIGDYIAKKRRKRLREELVRDAKDDYEDAISEQFAMSDVKAAGSSSALGGSLDELYGSFMKVAAGDRRIPGFGEFIGGWWDRAKDTGQHYLDKAKDTAEDAYKDTEPYLGMGAGALTTLAAITGIPAAMLAYQYARKRKKSQQAFPEAMRRRKAELARRRPQPVYLTPGEEVVHEEDDPVVESV